MAQTKRIFDILDRIETLYPDKKDVLSNFVNGEWRKYDGKTYRSMVDRLSFGLMQMGFVKGDKIASISNGRPEWNFLDMAMAQLGIVHVPIYTTISTEDFEYILAHSDAKAVFVASKQLYSKIKPIASKISAIRYIFTFDSVEGAANWAEIAELGEKHSSEHRSELEKIKDSITETDLFTIIYTSGTTGLSKGVMLSHRNVLANAIATAEKQHLNHKHIVLDFLPVSHIYARMFNYKYQYMGIGIYYATSLATIGDNIRELKVDGFITVPRILEGIHDKILARGNDLKGYKYLIFKWAVNLGYRFELNSGMRFLYWLEMKIADRLVFSKWRKALGGNIKFIGCGGAAMPTKLAKLFWAAGFPVYEGYGLTETSPIIALNYGDKRPYPNIKIGAVGQILTPVEFKINDDGEIICKGDCVMMGYYKEPEKTDEIIDKDGWFHTGDIGKLDAEGFLTITDRKKEIFKLSNGKFIAPQMIENRFKESDFIEQVMVVGENQKFASALLVPNFKLLFEWCKTNGLESASKDVLILDSRVGQLFNKEVDKINRTLGTSEQIKRFKLVADEWTVESGELSPTLKLKRKVIHNKHKALVEEIYKYDQVS